MELNSQYIHKTLEHLNEEKIKKYKYLIKNIEAVDKDDLQIFVLQLWEAFQQRWKDWAYRYEVFRELKERYNNFCNEIEHEEDQESSD